MKFIISILLTALLSYSVGLYLDWWSLALCALLVAALIHQRPGRAWVSGFIGIFLLWTILAWWIDIKNEGILSGRIASLLPLAGSTFLLILVTAVVGGIVGGFAALAGSYLRKSKSSS
jgi:hypothetical protein